MKNLEVITLSLATAVSGISPAYAYTTMPANAAGRGLVVQVVDQGHDWKHNLQDDPQPIRKHDDHRRDDRHHDDHRHSDNRNDHHDDHHHHHNNIGAILGGAAAGALIGGAVAPQRREYDDGGDYNYDDGGY